MSHFSSGGVRIAYDMAGQGDPVLLIHGFASSARINWVGTGWVKTLTDAGHCVITIDNRGHGESEKLYDPAGDEAPEGVCVGELRVVDRQGRGGCTGDLSGLIADDIVRAVAPGCSLGSTVEHPFDSQNMPP